MGKNKEFTVYYSFYLTDYVKVKANSEQKAIDKVEKDIKNGKIGNLNEMRISIRQVWVE